MHVVNSVFRWLIVIGSTTVLVMAGCVLAIWLLIEMLSMLAGTGF
jgi:hypothetical protein